MLNVRQVVTVIYIRKKRFVLTLVASIVLASCLRINSSFSALSESSYIVAKIGDFWVAQNGTSGTIEFNNTDASTTIQSCISNLTSNISGSEGGRILLRSGSYFLTKPLIIPRPDVTIEGEGWRATGLVANFSGDIIRIYSGNDTPYTHCVRIKNLLFDNEPNSNLSQTAIYLNIKDQFKLWYVDLEELYIIGMNGIRTDHVSFGTNRNVLQGWIIRDVFIENAPQFGIDLWATIDMTIDNVEVNFAQNTETYPVDNTAGIEITLSGESSGIYITNTRVLRAEWGITITGVRDIWMTNVISDVCKTWAFKLDNTINCILTNIYAHSPNGTGILISGNGSQNRIVGATVKDSMVGVNDTTPWNCPQYFDSVISESNISNSTDWLVKPNDTLTNCNYGLALQDLEAQIESLSNIARNQQDEINSINATLINLSDLAANLQGQLNSINMSLQEQIESSGLASIWLNESITNLQGQLDFVNSTANYLKTEVDNLTLTLNQASSTIQGQINSLGNNITDLHAQINLLNSTIQTSISDTQNQINLLNSQLDTISKMMYLLAAMTAVLIVTALYVAARKPKQKP